MLGIFDVFQRRAFEPPMGIIMRVNAGAGTGRLIPSERCVIRRPRIW
jgi:hypothetical protein